MHASALRGTWMTSTLRWKLESMSLTVAKVPGDQSYLEQMKGTWGRSKVHVTVTAADQRYLERNAEASRPRQGIWLSSTSGALSGDVLFIAILVTQGGGALFAP